MKTTLPHLLSPQAKDQIKRALVCMNIYAGSSTDQIGGVHPARQRQLPCSDLMRSGHVRGILMRLFVRQSVQHGERASWGQIEVPPWSLCATRTAVARVRIPQTHVLGGR